MLILAQQEGFRKHFLEIWPCYTLSAKSLLSNEKFGL